MRLPHSLSHLFLKQPIEAEWTENMNPISHNKKLSPPEVKWLPNTVQLADNGSVNQTPNCLIPESLSSSPTAIQDRSSIILFKGTEAIAPQYSFSQHFSVKIFKILKNWNIFTVNIYLPTIWILQLGFYCPCLTACLAISRPLSLY